MASTTKETSRSSAGVVSCHFVCLQKLHDPILLPDGETVTIGRSPQTKITDPRCSRTQLELTADWKRKTVLVKQKGTNASAVDGNEIGADKEMKINKDSTVFVLSQLFPHRVVFHYSQNNVAVDLRGDSSNVKRSETKSSKDKHKTKPVTIDSSVSNSSTNRVSDKTEARSEKTSSKNDTASSSEGGNKPSIKHNNAISAVKRHSTDTEVSHTSSKKMKTDSNSHPESRKTHGAHIRSSGSSSFKTPEPSKTKNDKNESLKSNSHRRESEKVFKSSERKNVDEDSDDRHVADVTVRLNQIKQEALQNKVHSNQEKSQKAEVSLPTSGASLSSLSHAKDSSKIMPKSASLSASSKGSWEFHGDFFVHTSVGVAPSEKIASFDLDGTIILTRSGKTFPEDVDDWKIFAPQVFNKMKDLHSKKFKIVFFTNQLGVAKGRTKIEDLKVKIGNIVTKLQVPIQVFVATHEGRCRKPMTGMWEKLVGDYNNDVPVDLSSSFYVGDAAGRQANWAPKKKKDFSCSDRLFALNVGLIFKTPEEFFLDQKPTSNFLLPLFDPRSVTSKVSLLSGNSKLTSISKEMIVLVGFPASGKSHFSTNMLAPKGYKVISRDVVGSWQKCLKKAEEALVNSSVVIDNTNLTKEERARYIECAKKACVGCRCFIFTTTVEQCRHNEKFRQMTTKHDKINEMIFNQMKKKYEEPSMTEGFTEIVNVNFVPKFSSAKEEADYKKFLLEK